MGKQLQGLKKYYTNVENLTQIERDTIDLSKPFTLYSSNIRLQLHERINVLERETVRIYKKKLDSLK